MLSIAEVVDVEGRLVLQAVVFTGQQSEGDGVDAAVLGSSCALTVGYIHLKLDRLLENRRPGCGLVLGPETGLRDDAVAETGNLQKRQRSVC